MNNSPEKLFTNDQLAFKLLNSPLRVLEVSVTFPTDFFVIRSGDRAVASRSRVFFSLFVALFLGSSSSKNNHHHLKDLDYSPSHRVKDPLGLL